MHKPLILVTRTLPDPVEIRLKQRYQARFAARDTAKTPSFWRDQSQDCEALIVAPSDPLPSAAIDLLPPSVRIIAAYSVGTDHIDLSSARQRSIAVTNTPDVLTDATAEIALLLMLGAARRAVEGDRNVRTGQWQPWSPTGFLGTQLTDKNLGIVGMGRIGQRVASLARGFGMTILYHNRTRLPEDQEEGAQYFGDLDAMVPRCQVLSLHCPATPENRHMLDGRRLALLPDGAIIVNTARGSLIDDAALIAELSSGRLRAGLDVFNNEPDIHPGYKGLLNAFLLPHVGSATIETRTAMGMRCLDNLDAFFDGRPLPHRVV